MKGDEIECEKRKRGGLDRDNLLTESRTVPDKETRGGRKREREARGFQYCGELPGLMYQSLLSCTLECAGWSSVLSPISSLSRLCWLYNWMKYCTLYGIRRINDARIIGIRESYMTFSGLW